MKFTPRIVTLFGSTTQDAVFDKLMSLMVESITTFDFFVDWAKVNANVKNLEMDLHALNYLTGKADAAVALAELAVRIPKRYRCSAYPARRQGQFFNHPFRPCHLGVRALRVRRLQPSN